MLVSFWCVFSLSRFEGNVFCITIIFVICFLPSMFRFLFVHHIYTIFCIYLYGCFSGKYIEYLEYLYPLVPIKTLVAQNFEKRQQSQSTPSVFFRRGVLYEKGRCSLYVEEIQISTEKSTGAVSDKAVKNSNSQFDSYLHLTGISWLIVTGTSLK